MKLAKEQGSQALKSTAEHAIAEATENAKAKERAEKERLE